MIHESLRGHQDAIDAIPHRTEASDRDAPHRCAKALMWIVRKSPTDSEADQLLELGGLKLAERLKGLHQDDLDLQNHQKNL